MGELSLQQLWDTVEELLDSDGSLELRAAAGLTPRYLARVSNHDDHKVALAHGATPSAALEDLLSQLRSRAG